MSIKESISRLTTKLSADGIKALIVPTNDAHFSEYVSNYDKCREFITGFKGSAGSAIISSYGSALWVDSRYFLQAEIELESTGIEIMRIGLEGTPSQTQWLQQTLCSGDKVAVDSKRISIEDYKNLKQSLPELEVVAIDDPFTPDIWKDRAPMPTEPIISLPDGITGEGAASKLTRVREGVNFSDDTIYIVTALDEVAWLCNIRGGDVKYNPVAIAYCAVESEKAILFIDKTKVDSSINQILASQSIEVADYSELDNYLESNSDKKFILNPTKTNYYIETKLSNVTYEDGAPIVAHLKSIKNSVEIEGYKRAMVEDGVALVKFNMWLEELLCAGKTTSEWEVSCKLSEFRAQSELNRGISFGSIVGYKDHGAIVHYSVSPESSKTITADGFLLLDSGGQYCCGTTDITRTLHLSEPTEKEQTDFTVILKGNINLALAIFPTGTRGSQLDILARKDMYKYGINYMHGTGHGVGHYLNVHEGPQSIRKEENSVTIKAGMVMSNEPAMYRTGMYGIRTENMIVVKDDFSTEYGDFLSFETITLFPVDIKCIKVDMLLTEERKFMNDYHKKVYSELSPRLTTKEKLWLALKTQSI